MIPISVDALIVDSDEHSRREFEGAVRDAGGRTASAATESAAYQLTSSRAFDLAIVDPHLRHLVPASDPDGLRVVAHLHQAQPECRIIAVSFRGGGGGGVAAIRAGAHDFISAYWRYVNWAALLRERIRLWAGVISSSRYEFETEKPVLGDNVIQVASAVDVRLAEYFRRYPEHLLSLSPREFEELVAELFDEFGFNVELTKRTRDGGRDIVAVSNRVVEAKYLIECKRYSPHRKVGVEVVRALHGVTMDEGATKGILVTTSSFTKDAKEHLTRNRWILEGRDIRGILEWLDIYLEYKMGRVLVPRLG